MTKINSLTMKMTLHKKHKFLPIKFVCIMCVIFKVPLSWFFKIKLEEV